MNLLLGMVTKNPLLLLWITLGAFAAGAISGGGAAWTVQGWRLDAVRARFDGFVSTTRAAGEAAQKAADIKESTDKNRKEQSDAENKRSLDRLRADNQRLRDARAGGSFVPAATPGAGRADLACFDRPELEHALRGFDSEVQGLIDEGDEAAVNLDTARTWARGQ